MKRLKAMEAKEKADRLKAEEEIQRERMKHIRHN